MPTFGIKIADREHRWKAEASLTAHGGPVRGFVLAAEEVRKVLVGHCHQSLPSLTAAAHHLATERKLIIWQRLRGYEMGASASEMRCLADNLSERKFTPGPPRGPPPGSPAQRRPATHAGSGLRPQASSSKDSIGLRSSFEGSAVDYYKQFPAAMLREGVGAPSFLLV